MIDNKSCASAFPVVEQISLNKHCEVTIGDKRPVSH